MSLTLYYHPLSSFCQKVLVALYETGAPFTPQIVNLMDPVDRGNFLKLWPIGKFPVIRDEAKDRLVPESSIIIEYVERHYPGQARLLPADESLAFTTRERDRFYDLYVEEPMQKIVGDRLRPADKKDPYGVDQAKARLATAYGIIEQQMAKQTWAAGESFTMADCGAAPALFYANMAVPFGDTHRNVAAYFDRLMQRPSFARVVAEAKPYFDMIPKP
jgi:glutathione S-transferase